MAKIIYSKSTDYTSIPDCIQELRFGQSFKDLGFSGLSEPDGTEIMKLQQYLYCIAETVDPECEADLELAGWSVAEYDENFEF